MGGEGGGRRLSFFGSKCNLHCAGAARKGTRSKTP